MTVDEFSDAFDTLVLSSGQQAQFDEYEKSLYLTLSQEQIVVELYNGGTGLNGFEGTEELRTYLRSLVKTTLLKETESKDVISKSSKVFILPSDLLFITYESAVLDDTEAGCMNGSSIEVIPVTQDEYHKLKKNPFRNANKRRAIRLDNGLDTVEVVSKYNIKDYMIRYLSKPSPIVLANFDEVSINNVKTITECKLDSGLHRYILERAVGLALTSRSNQNK